MKIKSYIPFKNFYSSLMLPVDASTLASFRIIFGLCLAWAMGRFYFIGDIKTKYIDREFYFTYYFFDWVTPLPGIGMYVIFGIVGLSALLIAVGLFYRMACVVFLLGYTYIFLLDQVEYNNHYYLICLLAFLFCLTHANRWMALDCIRKNRSGSKIQISSIPYWNVFVFKVQIFIVYFYGGISKLNGDWLRGEPMRGWLQHWVENDPDTPRFIASELFVYFISYGGLIFDLFIGFLLWYKKTRPLAIILVLFFHLTNNWMFSIGIFPFLALGATVLFLESETPRKLFHNIFPDLIENKTIYEEGKSQPSRLITAFVTIYLSLQVLIPFRHWLYPGNVAWTDEGRLFSWRMKLQTKEVCAINFMATNPQTGETWPIFPDGNLDYRQFRIMCGQPRKVVKYAHYLGKRLQTDAEVENPIIKVITKVSLNYRPLQPLIDPEVNLLEVDISPFYHAKWILPLKE